jgi:OHCU decarboxylase
MRAHPAEYDLVAPGSLPAVLSLMAAEPGAWLPIAGGTDVMVLYSAGKLAARKLVSIWNLPELRQIDVLPGEIRIGSGCTYTDLREHGVVNREFSLLSSAASCTGSIANQNRGTLGGNIVNASPAADSLPALLVYDAELILISARGERRVPYSHFHLDYRKTQLARDELIRTVCLKRQFSRYYAHARKIGARNAQAIAKVCLAALGQCPDGVIEDVRLAMGSVAPVPLRLSQTEQTLKGKPINPSTIQSASEAASVEVRPIDDLRSTSRYRATVAGNLVADFLQRLRTANTNEVSALLARWNNLPTNEAADEILPCCGSKAWARTMAIRRPISNGSALLVASNEIWRALSESDWMEAFRSHPRIGESPSASSSAQSATWSGQEQQKVTAADDDVKTALARANREYEQRFRRIFIVCASGKSPHEILHILQRRLGNDDTTELHESAEQQRQITQIRLKKWLSS